MQSEEPAAPVPDDINAHQDYQELPILLKAQPLKGERRGPVHKDISQHCYNASAAKSEWHLLGLDMEIHGRMAILSVNKALGDENDHIKYSN
jgi:hypothetical protein